jgi:hypothetical protein
MMMMMVLLALEAIKYGCGTYMGSRRPFAPSPDVNLYLFNFCLTSHQTKEIFFSFKIFLVGEISFVCVNRSQFFDKDKSGEIILYPGAFRP